MSEDVLHQRHYVDLPIQPIVLMLRDMPPAEFRGFLRGNILKYTLRAGGKNGVEDEEKALVYAKWLVEFDRTGTITIPGVTDRSDEARELHHYYSDSGSNNTVDAESIVRLLENLFPELAPKEANR